MKTAILRLAVWCPEAGVRQLALHFNRRYAARGITVGKTYVADTLKRHQYELLQLRRQLKQRQPRATPPNQVWGVDLTGKTDQAGRLHPILAVVDHGSRAALCLAALPNKSAWTLLGYLCMTIGRFGRPSVIRTDNEAICAT